MAIIDMHAHLTPERYKRAIRDSGSWYGLGPKAGELGKGAFDQPLSARLAEMDATGVDVQVLTPTMGFSQYENELETTRRIARECNDEIAEVVGEYPDRFLGMGTVPLQDVPSAIEELERVMGDLRMKGVIVRDHVNGRTYDEPEFLPFFRAAEELGAVVFFHQGGGTIVHGRTRRHRLGNAIGNLTERTLTFATLVFGGVMDACPNLKPLLAHAGGYTAFGIARMDKVAGALEGNDPAGGLTPPAPNRDLMISRAPSSYLGQFFYDCCTYDPQALRFLIDRVGIDRVVLGTDYPAPMLLQDAVSWIRGMELLSDAEKDAILSENATRLLGS